MVLIIYVWSHWNPSCQNCRGIKIDTEAIRLNMFPWYLNLLFWLDLMSTLVFDPLYHQGLVGLDFGLLVDFFHSWHRNSSPTNQISCTVQHLLLWRIWMLSKHRWSLIWSKQFNDSMNLESWDLLMFISSLFGLDVTFTQWLSTWVSWLDFVLIGLEFGLSDLHTGLNRWVQTTNLFITVELVVCLFSMKIKIPTSHRGSFDPSDDVKTRQSFVAYSNTCFPSVKTSPCALCVHVWVVLFNSQVPDGCRRTGFCKPKSISVSAHAVWIPPWRSIISMWRVKLQVAFKEQVWTCAGRHHETCAPTVCSQSLIIFKLFVLFTVWSRARSSTPAFHVETLPGSETCFACHSDASVCTWSVSLWC